jgi:cation:H+ antiporter
MRSQATVRKPIGRLFRFQYRNNRMEDLLKQFLEPQSTPVLLLIIAASLVALGKFADMVVDYAVVLSERSGIPKVIIGATVVSLGTTAPEVAVSVLAAFQNKPGLAMGNAVGSIICDTGLILGVACLIRPLTIPWAIANRQGWVQLGSATLLVLMSLPLAAPLSPWTDGVEGVFPRWAGWLFLGLLGGYLWLSVVWTRGMRSASESPGEDVPIHSDADEADDEADDEAEAHTSTGVTIFKLLLALVGVIVSANILIPAVTLVARRLSVPDSIIAATLVAFGTSLPELVTAVQAARRGHGDLAIGNIIGADILNALFVAGAAAAVTPGGLVVAQSFYWPAFPAMLFVLIVFRIGIFLCRKELTRGFGLVLLFTYLLYLVVSIISGVDPSH